MQKLIFDDKQVLQLLEHDKHWFVFITTIPGSHAATQFDPYKNRVLMQDKQTVADVQVTQGDTQLIQVVMPA